jgi:hypothetical protein
MQPTITRVIEINDVGDRGQTIASIRIEFKVGDHGPFSITFPKSGFSAAVANSKIAEFVSQLGALGGVK